MKEACRGLPSPSEPDMKRAKGIARYTPVVLKPVIMSGVESDGENVISAFVDSDCAGCRRSRKSTSGGARRRHVVQDVGFDAELHRGQ